MSNHAIKRGVQPWMVRRGVYLLVGLAGIIAAYFGIVDENQLDAVTASPLMATIVGWVAAAFTHEGSDSRATDADVARAGAAATLDVEQIATEVAGKLLPQLPLPTSSTLPVYTGPTSAEGARVAAQEALTDVAAQQQAVEAARFLVDTRPGKHRAEG